MNIKVPVILVVGEIDKSVPLDKVKDLYNHLNDPKSLIVIPGISHDYRHSEKEIEMVNEKIIDIIH